MKPKLNHNCLWLANKQIGMKHLLRIKKCLQRFFINRFWNHKIAVKGYAGLLIVFVTCCKVFGYN